MQLHPLGIEGAYMIEPDFVSDHRGTFTRLFSADELATQNLETAIAQINRSCSTRRGTLRGLHYQAGHAAEVKIVGCVRGRIYDVIVDVRVRSGTFGQWIATELSAESSVRVYVPRGCAHGFMSLDDDVEVLYTTSAPFSSGCERIVRWDDPYFRIAWPSIPTSISIKDSTAPNFVTASDLVD